VQLRHPAAVRQTRGDQVDLALEHLEVGPGLFLVRADDHVAAAESAALLAERQVDVDRQRRVAQRVGRGEVLLVVGGGEPSWNSTAVG